jgi:hypothetical protein
VCEGRFKEKKKRQGMTRQDNNTHTHEYKEKLMIKEIAIQGHE